MYEQRPPYASVVDDLPDRAYEMGEDFLLRLRKVGEALEKGGNCDAVTISFTHPQFFDRFRVEHPIYLLTVFPAAVELSSLSGENVERKYFGQVTNSPIERLRMPDLKQSLEGSNAVWLVSADARDVQSHEYVGYNHTIGIVPAPADGKYVVMDTTGYINPLAPLSIDELFDEIKRLPVGSDYVQGLISFRDAEHEGSEGAECAQKHHYFML